jgi:hypothetical protein
MRHAQRLPARPVVRLSLWATGRKQIPGLHGWRPVLPVLVLCVSVWSGCASVGDAERASADTDAPVATAGPAPSNTPQASCAASAELAMRHRTPVAAYGEHKLALVSGTVYAWRGANAPRAVFRGAVQVAVGEAQAYVLDDRRRLRTLPFGSEQTDVLLDEVVWMAAGRSGLLVIRCDGSLWGRTAEVPAWTRSANAVMHASVGDGADYYVAVDGRLFARGSAARGQYGNGMLTEGPGWTPVARDAVAVVAHSDHALYLRADGRVLGTGGNRHGPLGVHGFGDKADSWGFQFAGVRQIATGRRQSMAIRRDGSMWVWGEGAGFLPRRVLEQVVACSSGVADTIALTSDGGLWQWAMGELPARLNLPPAF